MRRDDGRMSACNYLSLSARRGSSNPGRNVNGEEDGREWDDSETDDDELGRMEGDWGEGERQAGKRRRTVFSPRTATTAKQLCLGRGEV